MADRIFGEIDGITAGTPFSSRADIAKADIHRSLQAGISGSAGEGSDSIVVSGGYEDDEDLGDVIIYTGEGGRDPSTGKQIKNQELKGRNLALSKNSITGLPVRVVRRVKNGYRYDGLFNVEDYWSKIGKSGYKVYQFRLVKSQPAASDITVGAVSSGKLLPAGTGEPGSKASWTVRIIRDTAVGKKLKELYGFKCQACNTNLVTPVGPYAEAAHIKPLGKPHNGPDTPDNVLCLCPNHHVLFDSKAFTIQNDFSLLGMEGKLFVHPDHMISQTHLEYHRSQYSKE